MRYYTEILMLHYHSIGVGLMINMRYYTSETACTATLFL